MKQISGDGHYDLDKVNQLRGKVISQEEVDEAAEEFEAEFGTICSRCRGNGYVGARPDDYGLQIRCEACKGTGERKT